MRFVGDIRKFEDYETLRESLLRDGVDILPPGGVLVPVVFGMVALTKLSEAMDKYAGSAVNPMRIDARTDFSYRLISCTTGDVSKPEGGHVKRLYMLCQSIRTSRLHLSDISLWPNGEHWTICTELAQLAV
jgi:hypothetical protein